MQVLERATVEVARRLFSRSIAPCWSGLDTIDGAAALFGDSKQRARSAPDVEPTARRRELRPELDQVLAAPAQDFLAPKMLSWLVGARALGKYSVLELYNRRAGEGRLPTYDRPPSPHRPRS